MVMTDQAWYIVRNTPGVTGFVGSHGGGSKPTPLLPDEVELVLRRLGMSARHEDLDVEVGETVKIVEGAFADLTGKITEIDNEKMKLKVNIEMFGRATSTELDFDQVDKLV
jgi:transcriptional antiterminator NusG